mmetsp:Transcript_52464/g.59986  ORF Transcript_52464/g.59986 Transcript_52464/m.59986 type:complete len:124 (+) Transcript_52464:1989-2360(+)
MDFQARNNNLTDVNHKLMEEVTRLRQRLKQANVEVFEADEDDEGGETKMIRPTVESEKISEVEQYSKNINEGLGGIYETDTVKHQQELLQPDIRRQDFNNDEIKTAHRQLQEGLRPIMESKEK